MAIEKGIQQVEDKKNLNGEAIEIEIVNPESVGIETEDGGIEIDFGGGPTGLESGFGENLAEILDESELDALGSQIVSDFSADKESRADWEETYIKGLDQLGLPW